MLKFNEKYLLPPENYHSSEFPKFQIVVGNSNRNSIKNGSVDETYFTSLKTRQNGHKKSSPAFTIDIAGEIYKHYDPKYYSDTIGWDIDKHIIPITVMNEGRLIHDAISGKFKNWEGKIYEREELVHLKEWRNYYQWASYTDKQYESLNKLIAYLTEEFNIKNKTIGHNTIVDGIDNFEGITSKSNYSTSNLDVSPAFDWLKLS